MNQAANQTKPSQNVLKVQDLSVHFGGIKALQGVDFEVRKGSITALIGPNGAGKTTVFNCVTGFYHSTHGNIYFYPNKETQDLQIHVGTVLGEALKKEEWADPVQLSKKFYYKAFGGSFLLTRFGIARTFQNIRLFKDMTVIENLLVAQHAKASKNVIGALLHTKSFQRSELDIIEKGYHWLKEVGLLQYANHLSGSLPYGLQRRLEIARAMCTDPELICLDEPAAGLNPSETEDLADLIIRLRKDYDVTVLVIEHDMSMVMRISDEIIVLDQGKVISKGTPKQVRTDPVVLAAYLGTEVE